MTIALWVSLIGAAVYIVGYYSEGSKLNSMLGPFPTMGLWAFVVGLLAFLIGK